MTVSRAKAAAFLKTCFSKLDLVGRCSVIAAVSGGSDSTALLFLLKAHLEEAAPGTKLVAVTVDHELRPDSAAEAVSVGQLCADHGIAHRTLRWTGAKPKAGLPAAAREARYRLLAEAAAAAGTDIVFTGHTRDDQAETISMRRRRGAGPGLAGMATATLYSGKVWILRPLLDTSRAALRGYLHDLGVGWIEDPTNRDMAFERVRVRAASSGDVDGASLAAAGRVEQAQRAAGLITAHASLVSPGLILLDPEFATTDHRAAAIHGLRVLLAVSGGTEHLPDLARATALFDRLGDRPLCATLSRTVVDVRRTGIFLRREQRGLPEPGPLGDGMVWDGRFRIEASGAGDGLAIAPLGMEYARLIDLPDTDVPKSLMRAALAAWPAVCRCGGQIGHEGAACRPLPASRERWASAMVAAFPLAAPWARFMPCFDLAAAKAVAALIGAPRIPSPPCHGHKDTRA